MVDFQPQRADLLRWVFARSLEPRILAGLADSPVVFLQGPRQCGKSTLVQGLAARRHRARYVSLDDPAQLAAARADPTGFLAGFTGNLVIDEVQSAPELFPVLKVAVDRERIPGRFLLTGSANALVVPEMARALTGRVDLVTLQGLSQVEIAWRRDGFVDWAFSEQRAPIDLETPRDLAARIAAGGFPEVLGRKTAERRAAWFDSYINTLLQRDVRDLAQIDMLAVLPNLLRTCAARASCLLNSSELARAVSLPLTTLKRYFTLLEAVFLVRRLPACLARQPRQAACQESQSVPARQRPRLLSARRRRDVLERLGNPTRAVARDVCIWRTRASDRMEFSAHHAASLSLACGRRSGLRARRLAGTHRVCRGQGHGNAPG